MIDNTGWANFWLSQLFLDGWANFWSTGKAAVEDHERVVKSWKRSDYFASIWTRCFNFSYSCWLLLRNFHQACISSHIAHPVCEWHMHRFLDTVAEWSSSARCSLRLPYQWMMQRKQPYQVRISCCIQVSGLIWLGFIRSRANTEHSQRCRPTATFKTDSRWVCPWRAANAHCWACDRTSS